MNESGAYLLKVTDYQGLIIGDIKESKFTLKVNLKEVMIPNNLFDFNDTKLNFQNKINIPIPTIVIVKNDCNMKIKGLNDNVVAIRFLYYYLKKKFSKKIYSIDQIDKLFDKINM